MAKTRSNMLPLGTMAPDFSLPDTNSNTVMSLSELRADCATVIMFICNHCPFVIHIKNTLIDIINDYQKQGVSFIAISANDVEHYPADAPDAMSQEHYPCPYLYDETQDVARAYDAACTPDFYIFDKNLALVYRGQFDDSRPDNGIPATGCDLTAAINAIITNNAVKQQQQPSIGCNIKSKLYESTAIKTIY